MLNHWLNHCSAVRMTASHAAEMFRTAMPIAAAQLTEQHLDMLQMSDIDMHTRAALGPASDELQASNYGPIHWRLRAMYLPAVQPRCARGLERRAAEMTRRPKSGRATAKPRAQPPLPPLFAPVIARLGKEPDATIAKQCGVSTYRIRQERRARGIDPFVGGGARPGSGSDPVLGPGQVRSVIKTVRLSPDEDAAQRDAAQRAGAKDWGTWIRDLGNAAAERSAQSAILQEMQEAGVTAIAYATGAQPGDRTEDRWLVEIDR